MSKPLAVTPLIGRLVPAHELVEEPKTSISYMDA